MDAVAQRTSASCPAPRSGAERSDWRGEPGERGGVKVGQVPCSRSARSLGGVPLVRLGRADQF